MAYKIPPPPDITGIAGQVFRVQNVDCTSTGTHQIVGVPVGFTVYRLLIYKVSVTNFTVNGNMTFGDNATSYDNVVSSFTINNTTPVGEFSTNTLNSARSKVTNDFYVNVGTAVTADNYVIDIYVIGQDAT